MPVCCILVISVILFILRCKCKKTTHFMIKLLLCIGIFIPIVLVLNCYCSSIDSIIFLTSDEVIGHDIEDLPSDVQFYIRTDISRFRKGRNVEYGKKFYLEPSTTVSEIEEFLEDYGGKESKLWFVAGLNDGGWVKDDTWYMEEYLGVVDDTEDIEWLLNEYQYLDSTRVLNHEIHELTVMGIFKFKRDIIVDIFER